MLEKIKEKFNALMFLASLGAGGIAVSGFILIQYGGLFKGKGLATFADIARTPLSIALESVMIGFGVLHIVLTILFFVGYFTWRKTENFKIFKENPLVNSALMAPLLSLAMSMNVVIAVVRYFTPAISDNFQAIMAPAFVGYVALWLVTIFTVLSLLKKAFINSFDVDKIHFGWLLQPFALAMITVTGTGFAALANNTETISYNSDIAGFAAFLALISGTMAIFLTSVKLSSIFKKHFNQTGPLEHQFMPTYLIVIPILTLVGISIFRLGHYAEHIFHAPILLVLAKIILLMIYAFQIWYFAFGLMMLKDYWRDYLKNNFHVSQWGLICPFVALVAFSGFVFKIFFSNQIFFYLIFILLIVTGALFFFLLKRQFKCILYDNESFCDK